MNGNGGRVNQGPVVVLQQPVVDSTKTSQDKEIKEGKIPLGATVKGKDGKTPIQDADVAQSAIDDKSLDQRKTEEVTARETDEDLSFEDAMEYLTYIEPSLEDDDEVYFTPAEVPEELQWVSDEQVQQAQEDAQAVLNKLTKFKSARTRLKRAVFKFVNFFKPSPELAVKIAEATALLAEETVDDPNDEVQIKEAADKAARLLEESPKALMDELSAKGMQDTLSELQGTMKIATRENLGKIKNKIMEPGVLSQTKAVEGKSQAIAELMVNGALIISKLANASDGDGDASAIQERGYVLGRIPKDKFDTVNWILGRDPETAIKLLSSHPRLENTNFSTRMAELERKMERERNDIVYDPSSGEKIADSLEDIFTEGVLPMFAQAEEEAAAKALEPLNARLKAAEDFEATGMLGRVSEQILKEGLDDLREVSKESIENSRSDMARAAWVNEKLKGTQNDAAAMGLHKLYRLKYKSGLLEPYASKVDSVYKNVHKNVSELLGDDMVGKATALTNAIMVHCGYGVFTNSKSADALTNTFHGILEQDFDDADENLRHIAVENVEMGMANEALRLLIMLANGGGEAVVSELNAINPVIREVKLEF